MVGVNYSQFLSTPWFLGEYRAANMDLNQIQKDLVAMDEEAKNGGAFLGTSVFRFQDAYWIPGTHYGLFGLGTKAVGSGQTGSVCEEDVKTKVAVCRKWPVNCLTVDPSSGHRADSVALAWQGTAAGKSLCLTVDTEAVV